MSVHTIEYSDGRSIELEFDPKKHYYMVDGAYVPATTTVLDNIAKPALLPSRSRKTRHRTRSL